MCREPTARLNHRNEVNRIVSAWTETKTRDEVIKLCSIGDVPCGPVNSIADIFDEPQYWERDTLVRVKDDRIGDLAVQGVVPKLSATPGRIDHLGPALGAHNEQIYRDWLGLDDDALAELRNENVI